MATTRQLEPTDVPSKLTVAQSPGHLSTPTTTITSRKDPSQTIRVVEFHGKQDMKVKERPMPLITDPVRKAQTRTSMAESLCKLMY